MDQKLFVTTPIYYVNDRPHIGHCYTTIAADVLARFSRMKNRRTFFLTGTDEHGSKVAESAQASGKSPQEFCDFNAKFYKEAWKSLSISYDYFVRTTDKRHEEAVFKFLDKLYKAKTKDGQSVIYPDEYEGLYCVGCEKFVMEKDLVDGLCPDHQKKPERVKEKNYFFRLSSFLEEVERLIQKDKIKILPLERRKEVLGLFKQELEDFSISREKVTWGIPLPFDPSQKVYVWVDALQNYISAIGYGDNQDEFDLWWNKSFVVHLIGKDILKFHCIFWPALLLAAGEKPPDTIFVHGFFTVDGKKMGKSLGNVVDPLYLIEKFGSDAVRYLLLTQFPFGLDGDIQEKRFSEKYNSDLANDLGNLVSRVLKMVLDFSGGEIPQPNSYQEKDKEIINLAQNVSKEVYEQIENINITSAADEILKLVRSTNKYIEENAPWNLAKNKEKSRLDTVLYTSCESLRFISFLFYPFLPEKCKKVRELLGLKTEDLEPSFDVEKSWGFLKPETKTKKPESLFPRWVKEKIEEKGKEKKEKEVVTLEEFSKLDMRVAKVIEAERVAGTNKLLKLRIDIGDEQRTIVAGIAENYSCEKLLGEKIVVITNLAPAKIKGIESKGMLLAAEDENDLGLVILDKDIKVGTKIS